VILVRKAPIIVITGSSGAGTSTVRATFEEIFRREGVTCAIVEGDAFHRYDREQMKEKMADIQRQGCAHFSRFGLRLLRPSSEVKPRPTRPRPSARRIRPF
jgi:phosphoribulokinase